MKQKSGINCKEVMEKLDQSSLHASIKHPETVTDISWPKFEPAACTAGVNSTKELSRLLTHMTILIRYKIIISKNLFL
jgi:hypothetical protein